MVTVTCAWLCYVLDEELNCDLSRFYGGVGFYRPFRGV